MGYSKRSAFKKKTVTATAIILILALLIGSVFVYFGNYTDAGAAGEINNNNEAVQQGENIQGDSSENAEGELKYITYSQNSNINIAVNYLSPRNKETDTLTFYIGLDTHSVDLSKYEDMSKYVELQTDDGIVVRDGFDWKLDSNEGHHIGGTLRIKNDIEGKPIVGSDTKSLKLIFKNIGDTGVREHIYAGDKLR